MAPGTARRNVVTSNSRHPVRVSPRVARHTVVEHTFGGDTVSVSATLPHPDRLGTHEGPPATSAADLELAVDHLASLIAGPDGDRLEGLEAVARAATRLARPHRHRVHLEEEMLPHVVLGEN
jgi:hypothetical protein